MIKKVQLFRSKCKGLQIPEKRRARFLGNTLDCDVIAGIECRLVMTVELYRIGPEACEFDIERQRKENVGYIIRLIRDI